MGTTMKWLLFVSVLWLSAVQGLSTALAAPPLPEDDLQRVKKAYSLALRVYKETKDAAGGVKSLEESAVSKLLKGRPDNMDMELYISILEDYAALLVGVPERKMEAAPLLKLVIEADKSRYSAYRSLGDLYYQLYQQQPEAKYQSLYQAAYRKYISWLRELQVGVALPTHIIDSVYAEQAQTACSLSRYLLDEKQFFDLNELLNPETHIEILAKNSEASASEALKRGGTFSSLIQSGVEGVQKSFIDIDNDGNDELHYSVNAGLGDCYRHLFYKTGAAGYEVFSNPLLDEYFKMGRICGQSKLSVLRFKGKNYLLEQQFAAADKMTFTLFDLKPDGGHEVLCTLLPSSHLQKSLQKNCDTSICNTLASNIDGIIAAEGQNGVEWLENDIASLNYATAVMNDPALQAFTQSQHQYWVDLNNDGQLELIARLWRQTEAGLQYEYRLFSKAGDVLVAMPIPENAAALGMDARSWFFVSNDNAQNYMVLYKVIERISIEGESSILYQLDILHWSPTGLKSIGQISVQQQ